MLRGPAGIGKSALGREIASQARERGWRVLRVQATGSGRAYAVITAIAEHVLLDDRAPLDRIGDAARNVLGLLSPLAAPAEPLPGPLGRHQVVGAIRRLIVAWAAGADVVVQVDDAPPRRRRRRRRVHAAGDVRPRRCACCSGSGRRRRARRLSGASPGCRRLAH